MTDTLTREPDVSIGNRRARCRFCHVEIGPQGGHWVDVETLDPFCENQVPNCRACNEGERHPHAPGQDRWRADQ